MTMPAPGWRWDPARSLRLVWRHRAWLLRGHLAVLALTVAVVFLLPRWYASSVTLVPAPKDGLSVDFTGMNQVLSGTPFGLGPTPQDQLKMVVRSRAVMDSLARAFDLPARWREKRLEDVRQTLAERTTVTTPKEGQVVVAVEARDPREARDLAAGYARFAASEGIRLKTNLASQRRAYLETRLRELDREIALAGAHVRAFEEANRAYSLPDQARATMDSYGALQSQVVLLQTELAAARRYFTDASSEVSTLTDRIAELERQLQHMVHEGGALQPQGDALPALRQQYLDLGREQASLVAVSDVVRRLYEQARVEEANPVPTFSVLDAAELPERHARPKRGLTVALAMVLAAAGSVTVLHGRESRQAIAAPERERIAA